MYFIFSIRIAVNYLLLTIKASIMNISIINIYNKPFAWKKNDKSNICDVRMHGKHKYS
jgi:hypothetical protein